MDAGNQTQVLYKSSSPIQAIAPISPVNDFTNVFSLGTLVCTFADKVTEAQK